MARKIREGKVLPGTNFSALADEIEVELVAKVLRIKHGHLMASSFLFVDDMSVVSIDTQQLKKY